MYPEEAKTQHNVRALVNVLKRHLPEEVRPFVHLGATSADILDTAAGLRYRDAVRTVILPLLVDLEEELIRRAREEAETPQIGRTHGQHAVPLTFGFALAEYVCAAGQEHPCASTRRPAGCAESSPAPWAPTTPPRSSSKDPRELESELLADLGLQASEHSTQLVEPEYLLQAAPGDQHRIRHHRQPRR